MKAMLSIIFANITIRIELQNIQKYKKALLNLICKAFSAFIKRNSMNYFFDSASFLFAFLALAILISFSISTVIGEAINTEEYVPIKIPNNMAKINPRIVSPPKINIESNVRITVAVVLNVRPNISFTDRLINDILSRLGNSNTFSRIRS